LTTSVPEPLELEPGSPVVVVAEEEVEPGSSVSVPVEVGVSPVEVGVSPVEDVSPELSGSGSTPRSGPLGGQAARQASRAGRWRGTRIGQGS
jgi:hypothetical protein